MEILAEWISGEEAARLLGISKQGVLPLIRRHELACRKENPRNIRSPWLYRRDEIIALANTPERLAQAQNREKRDQKKLLGEPPMEAEWVSTPQAAALLDVAPRTIRWMVETGLLHSRQKESGKRGSRHFFLRWEVEKLRNSPYHQKWHDVYRKGGAHLGRGRNLNYIPEPDEIISYWLHTKEVMYMLGVSATTVHALRKKGRIELNYLPGTIGYLHQRDDVIAYFKDPIYRKRHEAWLKSRAAREEHAKNPEKPSEDK